MRAMTSHRGKAGGWWVVRAVLLACAASLACTDANLYHRDRTPAQADRLTLRGQVCTDDPRISHFPLKVVLVVDQSSGTNPELGEVTSRLFSAIDADNPHFDPDGDRFEALRDLVAQHQREETTSFAVVGFGGAPRILAPAEGGFTRNVGELEAAISTLAIPQSCEGRSACRDLRGALGSARSLIEGDLVDLSPGARAMTRYVVILMLAGPPTPLPSGAVFCQRAIGGPACCDPTTMDCVRDLRARVCCPLGEQPCVPLDPASAPWCCDEGDGCPADECVAPPADCAAGVLVEDVRVMRETVEEQGVAGFNLHAIHLAAEADFTPGDGDDPNESVARLMQDIAFAGAGVFQGYSDGSALASSGIALPALGLLRPQVELEIKDFIVFNLNALSTPAGQATDTDADGLPDVAEADHGTDPSSNDSDGDGITDFVEVMVELSPLTPDRPAACEALIPGNDADLDLLTDCDEALLGTDPSLLDSDGDALPDRLEVTMGTDYVLPDWLVDSDNDGVPNGDEVRQHTDPRSSDAADHLATQYRYTLVDEGLLPQIDIAQPRQLTGVVAQRAEDDTSAGLGWLCYGAEPEGDSESGCEGVGWLCWIDPGEQNEAGTPQSCNACSPSNPAAEGQWVCLEGDGTYVLPSISDGAELEQDNGEPREQQRALTVEVTTAALPPRSRNEQILVHRDERHCLSYVVRNVKLAGTGPTEGIDEAGWNNIALYFAQAPAGRLTVPGLFRLAMVPVRFIPPSRREPPDAELRIFDDEFVRAGSFE